MTVPAERVRAEAGLQLLRRLAAAGLGTLRATRPAALGVRRGPPSPVLAGRVPDAARVAADLRPLADPGGGPLDRAARRVRRRPGQRPRRLRRVAALVRRLLRAAATAAAWDPHRQEYSFAVQAELPSGPVQLAAEEYTTGRLDWPDVDATLGNLGPTPAGRDRHVRAGRSACPCRPRSRGCRPTACGSSRTPGCTSAASRPAPPTWPAWRSSSSPWRTASTGSCCPSSSPPAPCTGSTSSRWSTRSARR